MALTGFNQTYTSNADITVPGNARDIYLEVMGGAGGGGYNAGANFGSSRKGRFKVIQDYSARTFYIRPGGGGTGGGLGNNGRTAGPGSPSGGTGGSGVYTASQYVSQYPGACTAPSGSPCANDGGAASCQQGAPSGVSAGGCAGGYGFGCCDCPNCDGTRYYSANTGAGGGGGGASTVFIGATRAVTAGGGGGGKGNANGQAGATASDFFSTNGNYVATAGSDGTGGSSSGGTGGGGGSASAARTYTQAAVSRYNNQLVTYEQDLGLNNISGTIKLEYTEVDPQITTFAHVGGDSSDGIPDTSVQINFSIADFVSATLTGPFGANGASVNINFNTGDTLSYTWNGIPTSSVENGNSPIDAEITLTAVAGTSSTTDTLTIPITNDNVPSNSFTTVFPQIGNGYDKASEETELLGVLAGVDMPTIVSCPANAVFFANGNNGGTTGFSNPQTFSNGDSIYMKAFSANFNPDTTGETGEFGKTNTVTYSVTVGGLAPFDVVYTTRAPRIRETFDYDGEAGELPFEEIDLPIDDSAEEFALTQILNMDDIEVDMEIKSDDPNVQIKINNQDWQNIQEI